LVVINTHKGLYRYNRLPFGVKPAVSIFQQIMNKMTTGLKGTTAYLDDLIVSGKDEKEHEENLLKLFERINEYGFRVRLDKCSFGLREIKYLGFSVDENGRKPLAEKVKAIQDMETPKNVSQLRSFLGMVAYYGPFIPGMR